MFYFLYYFRQKQMMHERKIHEKKLEESQIIISRLWHRRKAYLTARNRILDIIKMKKMERDRENEEDAFFVSQIQARQQQEQMQYSAWLAANPHVTFSSNSTHSNCITCGSVKLPLTSASTIPRRPKFELRNKKKIADSKKIRGPDPHIKSLLLKYGKASSRDSFLGT